MALRRSCEEIAATRELILDVAEAELERTGMAALTLRSIASRLGVSPMTPYGYFVDKADLLNELGERAASALAKHITDSVGEARGAEGVRRAALAYSAFARARRHSFVLICAGDWARRSGGADPVLEAFRARVDGLVGLAVPATRLACAMTLWAAIHGVVCLHSRREALGSDRHELEAIVSALSSGISVK